MELRLPVVHILQADDDEDERYFFQGALQNVLIRTHLTTVNDGEYLMNYLYASPATLPDILFLDLRMPRKDGWECLAEIKHSLLLKHIPVVIYSTSLRGKEAETLYKMGALHCLKKGDVAQLPHHIGQMLTLLQANALNPVRGIFKNKLMEAC